MSFIVEDGTGKINSTSYITVSEFRTYWTDRGVSYINYGDSVIQSWLIIATEFVDQNYKFYGYATNYATQSLQWPRTGLRDSKGNLIEENEIPVELKNAVCRLAKEAINTSDLDSKINTGEQSKTMGPVSITYKTGYDKTFKIVDKLLKGMYKNNSCLSVVS